MTEKPNTLKCFRVCGLSNEFMININQLVDRSTKFKELSNKIFLFLVESIRQSTNGKQSIDDKLLID